MLPRGAPRPVPPLPASRPRPVRLTGTGWLVAVIGALLPAGALVAGFSLHARAVREHALGEAIEKEAVRTAAVVSALTRTRGGKSRYFVDYEYASPGKLHHGRTTVSRTSWTKLRVGSSFAVRYLPAEPGRSWLPGREPGLPFWVGPVAALAIAVSSILPWYAVRRQWMLLAEGRGAMAKVTLSKKVRHQHGSRYRVSYEFRTMSGAIRSGRYDSPQAPPAKGAPIQIVYDPDRPEHCTPYPLALVRPA